MPPHPDAATVARRRHMVTMIVRSLIALFGAWILWGAVEGFGQVFQIMLPSSRTEHLIGAAWNFLTSHVPSLLLVVAIVFFEQRLVRWIVPTPRPDNACPKCGYSLKDLRSPICPECGMSLRS